MPECAAHIALAGVTALGWLGLGRVLLTAGPRTGDVALDALNRLAVGALAFGLLTLAAGHAGLLYPVAYVPVLGLAALAGLPEAVKVFGRTPRPRLRTWPHWQTALAVLLGVYVALAVLATCAPVSSADALFYHAASPAFFERVHEIRELPWSWLTYQPFTVEMLVLDGFLLWDGVQGAFAPLLLALAALAAVVGGAARLGGRGAGLLAGAVFFAQPFMLWEATSTFVEPGLALAAALAAWNLGRFVAYGEWGSLAVAGVLAGGAAGMKYVGLLVALSLALGAALVARRRLGLRPVLAFALPAVAVAAPWYVKNGVLTGDPLYPLLLGGLNADAEAAVDATLRGYGHGRGPVDALLLPFRLLTDADAFDRGDFVTPLFLAFAPLALLDSRRRPLAAATWSAALLYIGAWFVTTQQARFLVPLMPALSVLAALGALWLARQGKVGRLAAGTATTGALAAGLAVSLAYASQFAPVVAGTQSKRAFLAEKSVYYDGAAWLNEHLDERDVVLTDLPNLLYLDVPYVHWSPELLSRRAGASATRNLVARLGATHAAVLAASGARRRQLAYLDARLVARVLVRNVASRTLSRLEPPEPLLVYELPASRSRLFRAAP